MYKGTITYTCGHKDTLVFKPSPERRRALRTQICHNCYVLARLYPPTPILPIHHDDSFWH